MSVRRYVEVCIGRPLLSWMWETDKLPSKERGEKAGNSQVRAME